MLAQCASLCHRPGRDATIQRPHKPAAWRDWGTIIAQRPSASLNEARATLHAAAHFLAAGSRRRRTEQVDGPHRHRVIGNGLRELDRFLSVLLDEAAAATGRSRTDLRDLSRRRNTADKLLAVCGATILPADLVRHLSALGRCRDCLLYCDGWVRRGDSRTISTLTTGWPATAAGAAISVAIGERLIVGSDALTWICDFYRRIADDVVRALYGGNAIGFCLPLTAPSPGRPPVAVRQPISAAVAWRQ